MLPVRMGITVTWRLTLTRRTDMSLHPDPLGPVPEETARIARAAFPKGTLYLRLRDDLGPIYDDPTFADLFPTRGQPAETPWRLALVTVLQFAENLPDRQAAEAVRSRIDLKYLLGLELTDPGFDASVLCEFRARLVSGEAEPRLLDRLLTLCRERGLLKARGRQRTDSTHVLAAIRVLNRLECVGETLRHALNSLAVVAPDWLQALAPPAWYERYGRPVDNYRLPKSDAARAALAEAIGADGMTLLQAVRAPTAPPWLRQVPAVELLRRVWLQQYHAPDETGRRRWRVAGDLPPGAVLIISPYDPEARCGGKRDLAWIGYKAHVTETCDDDRPHLITHVETTPAATTDVELTAPIHAALAEHDLLPCEHFVDTGYLSGELLVSSRADHAVDVVGPMPGDTSWQALAKQGFAVTDFAIEWEAERVTCPGGQTSFIWTPARDRHGHDVIHVAFRRADCAACPVRPLCTRATASGRELTLRPRAAHTAIQAARQRQATPAFKREYARRAGVEGTLSQAIHRTGLRRARYVGVAKTHLQHLATAAALNLVRLGAWLAGVPLVTTRRAAFAMLAPGSLDLAPAH
jgi:transposase